MAISEQDYLWSHDGQWPPNPYELHNKQIRELVGKINDADAGRLRAEAQTAKDAIKIEQLIDQLRGALEDYKDAKLRAERAEALLREWMEYEDSEFNHNKSYGLIKETAELLSPKEGTAGRPISVVDDLPDDDIAVLALGDLDGWTVAHHESSDDPEEPGVWVEDSTGDRITVLKWMDLPGEDE